MGSQRNPTAAPATSPGHEREADALGFAESVVAWLSIVIGAGRVAQAIWTSEVWGAEATLCLGLLVFGLCELVRLVRARARVHRSDQPLRRF
jgi:hypothetical protein